MLQAIACTKFLHQVAVKSGHQRAVDDPEEFHFLVQFKCIERGTYHPRQFLALSSFTSTMHRFVMEMFWYFSICCKTISVSDHVSTVPLLLKLCFREYCFNRQGRLIFHLCTKICSVCVYMCMQHNDYVYMMCSFLSIMLSAKQCCT